MTRVRMAEPEDWSKIEAWRAGHFREMAERMETPRPVVGQRGPDEACWLVYEEDGEAVAATSFTVEGNVCFGHDLYAARGHILAAVALADLLEAMCDRDGYELRLTTDPENTKYLRLLQKRGYVTNAVELVRPRKESPA